MTGSAAGSVPGRPAPPPTAVFRRPPCVPASLSRATSTNGARTSSKGRASSASRKPISAGHASSASSRRSGGARRRASASSSDHSGSLRAVAQTHGAESGANRLRVQAVPGQPPLQPVPVPLPQGLAPRLEPFVHEGRVSALYGDEVAAQALLNRAGPLDYPHKVLLRHKIDLLHYRHLSNLPGLQQAREYDRGNL